MNNERGEHIPTYVQKSANSQNIWLSLVSSEITLYHINWTLWSSWTFHSFWAVLHQHRRSASLWLVSFYSPRGRPSKVVETPSWKCCQYIYDDWLTLPVAYYFEELYREQIRAAERRNESWFVRLLITQFSHLRVTWFSHGHHMRSVARIQKQFRKLIDQSKMTVAFVWS